LSIETVIQRSRDLRARALSTKAMPLKHPDRLQNLILEHAEFIQLSEEMEKATEGVQTRYTGLSARGYEVARLVTRGANGHSWRGNLSANVKPSELFQALVEFVRYLRDEP
jgi:hypothetical protein